jgi:hypothetical protein
MSRYIIYIHGDLTRYIIIIHGVTVPKMVKLLFLFIFGPRH